MARQALRIHRLPQSLEYALVPAPLNLTLPASEKSPLPSIIVTPSSPSTPESPYYIAFLAPPKKPSLCERVAAFTPSFQFKTRTALILLILLVVMFCHMLMHRLVVHPDERVDFSVTGSVDPHAKSPFLQWLYSLLIWDSSSPSLHDGDRVYIVSSVISK